MWVDRLLKWIWASRRLLAAAVAFALLALAAPAADDKPMRGVALIVGNGDYEHLTPLANPKSDAEAIEDLFDDLGFETFDARDADARKLRRSIERFIEDAEGADIAVVYYAGHGIEAGGENYLVPVDADIASLDDAGAKLVPLNDFLKQLREAVPMSIMLLDACRNNPFPPGALVRVTPDAQPQPLAAAGLGETRAVTLFRDKAGKSARAAQTDDSLGTLIGFAAEPGATALDGDPGSNSPYAAAVLRHVPAMAGEEIGTVMRMVAEEVYLKTDGRQRPWVNENLRRLIYLGAAPAPVEGAEGDILRERRQLLVNIAALPDPERRKVETVAREGGVTMDSVYGMLRALGDDAPKDPARLEALLREQVSKIKQLESERAAIKSTDPEITRLAGLADQAMAEGALNTAIDLHDQAKSRVREVEKSVDDAEADIRARRLEFADVFARSGEANFAAFNYEESAHDYEEAFRQAERWDDFAAWSYRGNQAKSLSESGWKGGATENLRKAADLAREVVRLSERLEERGYWALSQTFYRREMWRGLGFASLEDFLVRSWEANFLRRDARDLLAQLWTWQNGDISANDLYRGDLEMALAGIKAKVLLMPSATDLYFQTDDNRAELPHLKYGKLAEIPSVWGHRAGNPRDNPEDAAFIDAQVEALLAA